MEELIKSLLQGIRELNIKLSELDEDLTSTQKELNGFESEYAKEVKTLQESIEYLNIQIDKTIKEEIAKIPTPKDGESVDEAVVRKFLTTQFDKLAKERKAETINIKKEIVDLVKEIPIPKDGVDGSDAKEINYDEVQSYVFTWLDSHKDDLKGERGTKGLDGKSGSDGRSIDDVTVKKDVMTIHFSDDTTKEIKLPKTTKYLGGGGSSGSSTAKETTYDNSDSAGLTATNVKDALDELSEASGGVSDLVFKKRTELENMFQSAYATAYSELTYIDGSIDKIDVWELDDKTTHLFTKQLTYTLGNITKVVISNITDTTTLTKDIFYDVNGNITSTNVA